MTFLIAVCVCLPHMFAVWYDHGSFTPQPLCLTQDVFVYCHNLVGLNSTVFFFFLSGYLIVKWLSLFVVVCFPGKRSPQGIIQWMKRRTGPGAPVLDSADSAAEFIDSNKISVVGFFDVRLPLLSVFTNEY